RGFGFEYRSGPEICPVLAGTTRLERSVLSHRLEASKRRTRQAGGNAPSGVHLVRFHRAHQIPPRREIDGLPLRVGDPETSGGGAVIPLVVIGRQGLHDRRPDIVLVSGRPERPP